MIVSLARAISLPAMPFACLGVAGFRYLATVSERRLAAVAVVLAGAFSFVINLVGALRGAMNCPHGQNAFGMTSHAIQNGGKLVYPLALWLLLPLLVCTTALSSKGRSVAKHEGPFGVGSYRKPKLLSLGPPAATLRYRKVRQFNQPQLADRETGPAKGPALVSLFHTIEVDRVAKDCLGCADAIVGEGS